MLAIKDAPAGFFPSGHEYLLPMYENYDYRHPKEQWRHDFSNPENWVGYQQRAFVVWWGIELCGRTGDVGLDIGSFGVKTPYCLSTDKFSTLHHPDYYGGPCIPQLQLSGEDLSPIGDATIPLIVGSHVMEHLTGSLKDILAHWWTKLKPGGIVAQVIPDNGYNDVMKMDPSHTHAYSAAEFKEFILDPLVDKYDIVEFDQFQNKFSFEVVLRKR